MATDLEICLRKHFHHDVLIPCDRGQKRPLFPHAHNSWTWENYDDFLRSSSSSSPKSYDLCVVLSDLCVVDIDDPVRINEFENLFKDVIDCGVPRSNTSKGRHYWFIRPEVADERGYYDGRAQRRSGVDFKSVCSTGTGGVISVPPSLNKSWLHPPYKPGTNPLAGVFAMPLGILNFVARPTLQCHPSKLLRLCFHTNKDSTEEETVPAYAEIQGMAYFVPLMATDETFLTNIEQPGGQADETDEDRLQTSLPVPCNREVFMELLFFLRMKRLSGRLSPYPDRPLLLEMVKLCRFLGVVRQEQVVSELVGGLPQYQVSTLEMFPEWWKACKTERCEEDAHLVDVNLMAASGPIPLLYHPHRPLQEEEETEWKEQRLFPDICQQVAYSNRPHGLCPDQAIIPDQPSQCVIDKVDWRVKEVLKAFPGKIVLAGGAALATVCHTFLPPGRDYDLFIVGSANDEECNKILDDIRDMLILLTNTNDKKKKQRKQWDDSCVSYALARMENGEEEGEEGEYCESLNFVQTGTAATMVFGEEGRDGHAIVQVIIKKYPSVAHVLSSFDIGPCKIAITWGATDSTFKVLAAPTWAPCMQRMAFPIDIFRWSTSSVYRVCKYFSKGFEVFVPGVDRARVQKALTVKRTGPNVTRSDATCVTELFKIEKRIISHLGYEYDPCIDIARVDQEWPSFSLMKNFLTNSCRSDYEANMDIKSSIVHVVMNMIRRSYNWLKHNKNKNKRDRNHQLTEIDSSGKRMTVWPSYISERPVFYPAKHRWNEISKRVIED